MPRPRGRRNADFEERRRDLAQRASSALLTAEGMPTSLGAVSTAVGVSVPTLKHYFVDHDGVVEAALQAAQELGRPHLERTADPGSRALDPSMRSVAHDMIDGWSQGLGHLFAGALTHGLAHPRRGRAAVEHILEPTLHALEQRLSIHRDQQQLREGADLRTAALGFLSPLLMALLHQRELSGAQCRPLDLLAFADVHVEAWVRAWARD